MRPPPLWVREQRARGDAHELQDAVAERIGRALGCGGLPPLRSEPIDRPGWSFVCHHVTKVGFRERRDKAFPNLYLDHFREG